MTDVVAGEIALLSAVLYAFCDAAMDAIRDKRTHLGLHPYRDFWHLLKHLSRLFLCSFAIFSFGVEGWGGTAFVAGMSIFCSYWIWKVVYEEGSDYFFDVDEKMRISTGIKWLDKLLGFHW